MIRRAGVVRLRELELPALERAAALVTASTGSAGRADRVERLLRKAVDRIGGGTLQEAAEYSLGLARGTRDWPPGDRRRRAAALYGVSVERFRKHQEMMVLGEVAEQVIRISAAAADGTGGAAAAGPGAGPPGAAAGAAGVLNGGYGGAGSASTGSASTGAVGFAGAATGSATGVVGVAGPATGVAGPASGFAGAAGPATGSATGVVGAAGPATGVAGPATGAAGAATAFAAAAASVASVAPVGASTAPLGALPAAHRTLHVPVHGRTAVIGLHVHPVDLLRDVDVVVSPTNTYLTLPSAFKSSVSASLRRAGARRDVTGGLVEDCVHDELRRWTARHGGPGRAVLPGTVAATGSGALAGQGVRRIYHAAVAVPRSGTNDYDIAPADVTRATARALDLLAQESTDFDPPLRSICFPLMGSGRGGLPYEVSLGAVWTAVEAELARGARWDVHLVVRGQDRAELVERLLTGSAAQGSP